MTRVAGLFAGIGGFELGMSRAGHSSLLLCEIERSPRAVLAEHFPQAILAGDVQDLAFLPNDTETLVGGFPCQDLSTIGGKSGISGTRSRLISEVFRLAKSKNVDRIVLENVPNLLKLQKGEGMLGILEQLERMGYDWAYRILDTRSFGLPQKRRRIYIVASRVDDPRDVLLSGDAGRPDDEPISIDQAIGFYWTEGRYGASLQRNAVPTLKTGSTLGIPSLPAILFPDGRLGTPDIRDAERLQGFPEDWTIAAEGLERGARFKMVGNAVSVPVSEWIGIKIKFPEKYDTSGDMKFPSKRGLPNAAWGVGGVRRSSSVGEWPLDIEMVPITKFLRHPVKPLSIKAATGFAKRITESTARYPEGFRQAIETYCENLRHAA